MLFIRSRGIRDNGGRNLDTVGIVMKILVYNAHYLQVLNINEDDCIFSCISNLVKEWRGEE